MSDISFARYSGLLLRHNLDIVKRELVINGTITPKTLTKLDKHLKLLENQPDPITVIVNTGGGDVEVALGIVDRFSLSPCKINTIGTCVVMSAGVIILAAGYYSKATRYTRFMYHGPSVGLPVDRISNIDAEVKYTKELGRIMDRYLSEHTAKPYSFWATLGKHVDNNFGAEQALEYGLIDEII